MPVLRRVLPLLCSALILLLAVSALGQSAKKTTKTKRSAAQAGCGVDGDGNPIPPANCAVTPASPPPAAGTAAAGTPAAAATATVPPPQPAPPACTSTNLVDGSFDLSATVGSENTHALSNPITIGPNVKVSSVKWLTEALFQQPNASASATANLKPFPFTLAFSTPDPTDQTKAITHYLPPGSDLAELGTVAKDIVIRFLPNESGKAVEYLRLTWKPDKANDAECTRTYKVTGEADIPDYAKDSRYKIWAYTGYTFLRSHNDFTDSFAELLVRVETRWIDGRIAMKQHDPIGYAKAVKNAGFCDKHDNHCLTANFPIVRIYGAAGLTGTSAVATGEEGNQATIGGTTQSFGGNFGVGVGWTRLVSFLRPEDTSAFSLLFVPRLGLTSVPAAVGNPNSGFTAFDYSTNIRLENEPGLDAGVKAGNFEGAYFEIGWGESEQFSRKKYPRLRADGLLPIPGGSDLFRFALRLQIDAARPFAKVKTNPSDNLTTEIRISALFNINLLELGKRISGK